MTSKTVAEKLVGPQIINTCSFCGGEYVISESSAWNMSYFCSGECEFLDEQEGEDE